MKKALLSGMYLSWTDNVRHLGNYMCSNNDGLLDCTRKKFMFIGYVNPSFSPTVTQEYTITPQYNSVRRFRTQINNIKTWL